MDEVMQAFTLWNSVDALVCGFYTRREFGYSKYSINGVGTVTTLDIRLGNVYFFHQEIVGKRFIKLWIRKE